MFENLTDKLGNVFKGLTKRGSLSESDVDLALQEVRSALLEADVALSVVRDFISKVRERAIGEEVLRSITPGQQVIKIVNDVLIEVLGSGEAELSIDHSPPAVILLVGLQGSGKTTTAGKLALHLKSKKRKKVMLASLDIYRPAAREQLRILGEQAEVSVLPEIDGESPANIAKRAMAASKVQAIDVLILDTAGRTTLDTAMMSEAREIFSLSKLEDNEFYHRDLMEFEVYNLKKESFGKIKSFNDFGGGLLIEVKKENKLFYLPVGDNFLEDIDYKKKEVIINLDLSFIEN
ncbi:signal recognition particle receptor subunit alpha [Alphaproteobacteria bacterium]|nr:signal recognition particle receptor subunit alpha [Alphaproteobacteria bacterium]